MSKFKVGDELVLLSYPDSKYKRVVVGVHEEFYYLKFGNEKIPTQVRQQYIDRKFRKLTKLEQALK